MSQLTMLRQSVAAVTRAVRRSQTTRISLLFIWLFLVLIVYNHVDTRHALWAKQKVENHVRDMMQKVGDLQEVMLPVPANQEEILARSFRAGQVRQVILLSYNRCGSTFLGQIFNHNPTAFYMYEPIDAIYSSMYGTAQGWNVASDIFTYSNGTERQVPEYEMDKVADVLGKMLSCEFDDVPSEVFFNHFWGFFSTSHERLHPYIKCLRSQGFRMGECRNHIKPVCAQRFGTNYHKLDTCRPYMMEDKTSGPYVEEFNLYHDCLASQRRQAGRCIRKMKDICLHSSIRSTKTVRMTMEVGEKLLRRYRNMRIIHLFRDPRAVALSRMSHSSFRGLGNQIVEEAKVYCEAVLRDVHLRRQLEVLFPGSTMQILYENFVLEPRGHLQVMYEFLNATVPGPLLTWLENNTQELKNSSAIAARWQNKLTYKMARDIDQVCHNLLKEINYRWP